MSVLHAYHRILMCANSTVITDVCAPCLSQDSNVCKQYSHHRCLRSMPRSGLYIRALPWDGVAWMSNSTVSTVSTSFPTNFSTSLNTLVVYYPASNRLYEQFYRFYQFWRGCLTAATDCEKYFTNLWQFLSPLPIPCKKWHTAKWWQPPMWECCQCMAHIDALLFDTQCMTDFRPTLMPYHPDTQCMTDFRHTMWLLFLDAWRSDDPTFWLF